MQRFIKVYSSILLCMLLIHGCNNTSVKGSKLKENTNNSLSSFVKFSEADSSKVAVTLEDLKNAEPYEVKSLKIEVSEFKDVPIEIKPDSDSIELGRLAFDLNVSITVSPTSSKTSLICSNPRLPVLLADNLACTNDSNSTPPGTEEKLPTNLSEVEKLAWKSMIEQCNHNVQNQIYRDSTATAQGCYCSIPDIQVSFSGSFIANNSAPVDFAKANFTEKCTTKSPLPEGAMPIMPQMEKTCSTAVNSESNITECHCFSKTNEGRTIVYNKFLNSENPVHAFFLELKEKCDVP